MAFYYRIENRFGEGMYRATKTNNLEVCWFYEWEDDADIHLIPSADSKLWDNLKYIKDWELRFKFAFSSLEQLRNWLYEDKFLIYLHDNGFFLTIYQFNDDEKYKTFDGYRQSVIPYIKKKEFLNRTLYSIKDFFKIGLVGIPEEPLTISYKIVCTDSNQN